MVPRQLTPTAIYEFSIGQLVFAKVVVLGQYGMSTGGSVQYQAHHEHWFTDKNITSLAEELANASSMSWSVTYQSPTAAPDQDFIDLAKDIDSSWGTFQLYAKSLLSQNDWQAGPLPSLGNVDAFLFVNEQAQQEAGRPRVAPCIDASDPTALSKVLWLTGDDGIASYGASSITLSGANLSNYTGSQYYHYM